jgi:hypothetical protein
MSAGGCLHGAFDERAPIGMYLIEQQRRCQPDRQRRSKYDARKQRAY